MIETSDQLRRLMALLGITQPELGKALGRDRNYVSNLIRFGIPRSMQRRLNEVLQRLIDQRASAAREYGFRWTAPKLRALLGQPRAPTGFPPPPTPPSPLKSTSRSPRAKQPS